MLLTALWVMSEKTVVDLLIVLVTIVGLEMIGGIVVCIVAFVKMGLNKTLGVPQPKSHSKQP